jgi:regulator of sigma E protease
MSVGIFNLLPIGMLDGGQILIALIEMLRRGKRIPMKLQNAFFGAGMALLLILFLVVMRQDINRFIFPSDEVTAKEIITEPKPQTALPSTKP